MSVFDNPKAALYHGPIAQILEERFDQAGVSNDVLEIWVERESLALKRASAHPMDLAMRALVLRKAFEFARVTGESQERWVEVGLLLDIVGVGGPASTVDKALARTAAAWMMCMKMEPTVYQDRMEMPDWRNHMGLLAPGLARQASHASASLGGKEILKEDIFREETEIFLARAYSAGLPTLSKWHSSFTARFNITTGGKYSDALAELNSLQDYIIQLLVWRVPASSQFKPRDLGIGIFVLSLIAGKVLQPEWLWPDSPVLSQWWAASISALASTQVDLAQCTNVQEPLAQDVLNTCVEFATHCSKDRIQDIAKSFHPLLVSQAQPAPQVPQVSHHSI